MKKGDWILIVVVAVAIAVVLFFSLGADEGVSSDSINPNIDSGAGYTMAEIETNSLADKCWVVYSGSVYDMTPMISAGKHKPIDNLCGTDVTEVFDGVGKHSFEKLSEFYIGELE